MKKTLSIILSFVMLICTASFAGNAFAYKKKAAPKVTLGESFTVKQKAISASQLEKIDMNDLSKTDFYCAKFVPEKTGYYEFVFDTDFTDKSSDSVLAAYVFNKVEQTKVSALCVSSDRVNSKEYKDLSLTSNPSVCTKLYKDKDYYLAVINVSKTTYKSKVVINKHSHSLYNKKMRSYVDNSDLKKNYDGCYYSACNKNGCNYLEETKKIYSVKKITLSHNHYNYNGKAKRPIVTVKDRKGNKISKKNYKVKYSKNTAIGTAEVKITFKKEYEGSFTKTFRINPKGSEIETLTPKYRGFEVKYRKRTKRITGYQVQYAEDKAFSLNKKTVTVEDKDKTSQRFYYLKSGTKYYVRVRTYKTVDNKKYYSKWSKVLTVKTK